MSDKQSGNGATNGASAGNAAGNAAANKIHIDVISDVMCPWCYIGKRNLEAADEALEDVDLEVVWRPYQLDPTLPPQGKNRQQYLSEKFGGEDRARELYERVHDAGMDAGIDFRFDAIAVSPNTLDAHRLIMWAGGQGESIQNKLVDRLFRLYFLEGANIGDHQVLADAATAVGLDAEVVLELLETDRDKDTVRQEIASAQQMGVTGVPCFIIDRRIAVMGAQPPAALVQAIRQALGDAAEEAEYTGE